MKNSPITCMFFRLYVTTPYSITPRKLFTSWAIAPKLQNYFFFSFSLLFFSNFQISAILIIFLDKVNVYFWNMIWWFLFSGNLSCFLTLFQDSSGFSSILLISVILTIFLIRMYSHDNIFCRNLFPKSYESSVLCKGDEISTNFTAYGKGEMIALNA